MSARHAAVALYELVDFDADSLQAIEAFATMAASVWEGIAAAARDGDLDAIDCDLRRARILTDAVVVTIDGPGVTTDYSEEFNRSAREWRVTRDRDCQLEPFPDSVDVLREAERRGIEARKRTVLKPRPAPEPVPVSIPYPEGFARWPLDQRNAWWAEANPLYTAAQKGHRP